MSKQQSMRRVGSGFEMLEPRLPLAASLLPGFADLPVVSGLAVPTAMAIAPDGRIFIDEKGGDMRVVKNGALLAAPFLQLSVDDSGERGLLGVALDPNFAANNFVYAYYTTSTAPIHNRVSRFTANGDVVVPGSEVVLLNLENLSSATNHNGGAIHFGVDGKLYIAVGENATPSNSQTLTNRLGKMLRINSDGTIPANNPYVGVAGARPEIWALGLRNPFTFAVQPGTGAIFINDVGGQTFEEINRGAAGANYGWPAEEGPSDPPNPNFVDPLFAYQRDTGAPRGRAITGGTFYNPATNQFPPYFVGDYFFADYLGGFIWRYDLASDTAARFATSVGNPVDLQVRANGDLLYLDIFSGELRAIRYVNDAPEVELGANAAYTENTDPVAIAPAGMVTDADSPTLLNGWLHVRLTANAQSSDRLSISDSGNISTIGDSVLFAGQEIGTFAGGIGSAPLLVKFLSAATPVRAQALLRSITYHNVSENPSAAPRTVQVLVSDGIGATSVPDAKQINVTPTNDRPGLAFIGGQVGYQLNAAAIRLAASAIVSDVDSPNFDTGKLIVEITSGIDAGNRLKIGGYFTVDGGGNVLRDGVAIGTVNAGGGVGFTRLEITFNAQALPAYVQQLVRAIRFRTVGSTSTLQRTIDFTVEDGDGAASVTRSVTVDVT